MEMELPNVDVPHCPELAGSFLFELIAAPFRSFAVPSAISDRYRLVLPRRPLLLIDAVSSYLLLCRPA